MGLISVHLGGELTQYKAQPEERGVARTDWQFLSLDVGHCTINFLANTRALHLVHAVFVDHFCFAIFQVGGYGTVCSGDQICVNSALVEAQLVANSWGHL